MTRFNLIIVISITILLPTTVFVNSEVENQNTVVELNPDNFDEAVSKNNHFIKFYAPWCGHCKRLHPLWEQLAEMLNVKDAPNVIIAKVDCTKHNDLCSQYDVTGYPTLRFFKAGSKEESVKFKGMRDMPTMTEFINQQIHADDEKEENDDGEIQPVDPGKSVELTEANFAKKVSSGNHFVKFYAPWCTHCQRLKPTWEKLADTLKLESAVSIAKIDCTAHRPICQDFEVKGYPTLLWIENGKKIDKYTGSREHDALHGYVEKMLGYNPNLEAEAKEAIKIEEQDLNKVIQLNADNFKKTIADGIAFVKFYAPWCGHCKKLSPIWDQLAEKLNPKRKVKIAKVDCTEANNRELCASQQVSGYPTVYAYAEGKQQKEYDGSRSLQELEQYILKFVKRDEL